MQLSVRVGLIVMSLGLAVCAQAATSGRGELGFVMNRGNSDTETANAKVDIINERRDWRHTLGLAGLYGRTTDATIATRWNFAMQTDRRFGTGAFWFANVRYDDDRFSGFDYQGTVSTGFGREFINSADTKLHGQIGAGYRALRTELLTFDDSGVLLDRAPGEKDSDVIVNGALNFEHAFNHSTKVINTLSLEAGQSNTLTRNDLALQVKMTHLLAISLGFSVRNNSNPPSDLEKRDTLTTVNIVYERK